MKSKVTTAVNHSRTEQIVGDQPRRSGLVRGQTVQAETQRRRERARLLRETNRVRRRK